jgi:hypothetical protein
MSLCPDLIRPIDGQIPRQVLVDLMLGMRRTGVALAINGRDTDPLHERANLLATDPDTLQLKHVAQHAGTGEREVQVQLVDPAHQLQIDVGYRPRQVVHVRA